MKFKKLSITIIIALIGLFTYEAVMVYKARSVTKNRFFKYIKPDFNPIHLVDIPEKRLQALLKVQDPNFYHHNGLDFKTPGAGLTTITQAIVKFVYFDHFRSGFMKIEQSLIAWLVVNPMISKNDQLTVFINNAYLGTLNNKPVIGFEMASKRYFGKTFKQLSDEEYLSLVAMLIAPDGYSIKKHPEKNRTRVKRIKRLLSGEYKPYGLQDLYYSFSDK